MNSTKEMNLFDLCALIGHKIASGIKSLIVGMGYAIRLSYRQWWIVLIIVSIAVALGLYYSRENNRIYKVDAVAVLNGATKDVVSQEFTALSRTHYKFNHQNLATILSISPEIANKNHSFRTYDVIDCLADDIVDYIDFDRDVPFTDTLAVHIPDMLALQFRTKDPNNVPLLQEAILQYLNTREGILSPHAQFYTNLQRTAKFHHDQLEKLDSLTSAFYFSNESQIQLQQDWSPGFVLGRREIKLFLEDIQEEIEELYSVDQRLAYASAPVVLQTAFTVNPHAINGPIKCSVIALLLGWAFALVIAALVEQHKAIITWLKQK